MGSEPYSSVSAGPSPPLFLEEAVGTPMLSPWGLGVLVALRDRQ